MKHDQEVMWAPEDERSGCEIEYTVEDIATLEVLRAAMGLSTIPERYPEMVARLRSMPSLVAASRAVIEELGFGNRVDGRDADGAQPRKPGCRRD